MSGPVVPVKACDNACRDDSFRPCAGHHRVTSLCESVDFHESFLVGAKFHLKVQQPHCAEDAFPAIRRGVRFYPDAASAASGDSDVLLFVMFQRIRAHEVTACWIPPLEHRSNERAYPVIAHDCTLSIH